MSKIDDLKKQYEELEVQWDKLDAKPFNGSKEKQDEISMKMGLVLNEISNILELDKPRPNWLVKYAR